MTRHPFQQRNGETRYETVAGEDDGVKIAFIGCEAQTKACLLYAGVSWHSYILRHILHVNGLLYFLKMQSSLLFFMCWLILVD